MTNAPDNLLAPEQRQRAQALAIARELLTLRVSNQGAFAPGLVDDMLRVADWILDGGTPLSAVVVNNFKQGTYTDMGFFDQILNHLAGPQHLGGCVVTEEAPLWMKETPEHDYLRVPLDRIVWMAKQYDVTVYRDPKTNHLYLRTPCEEHDAHVYTTRPHLADA